VSSGSVLHAVDDGRNGSPLYGAFFRTIFARMQPERAHRVASVVIRAAGLPIVRSVVGAYCRPSSDAGVSALGLSFPSPFGLAAGFDKNADMTLGLGAFGFGHVEVGTVTAHPQPGNPAPRLFRLIADRALINRMGFNNDGAEVIARRLERLRRKSHRPIIGVNIGKSRIVDVADAQADYLRSTELLAPLADYLVVNVSSPNTPGLRGLQELDTLEPLLVAVRDAAAGVPLLVKIAPDLDDEQVEGIARLSVRLGLAGIIATNTTISRAHLATPAQDVESMGAGGLSGPPVAQRSNEVLRRIRLVVPTDFCVISVGGVETAADVLERLMLGATLVQGYTAYIYQGPFWARRINRQLSRRGRD
jgi:dihydroorotate dehydrogenase